MANIIFIAYLIFIHGFILIDYRHPLYEIWKKGGNFFFLVHILDGRLKSWRIDEYDDINKNCTKRVKKGLRGPWVRIR